MKLIQGMKNIRICESKLNNEDNEIIKRYKLQLKNKKDIKNDLSHTDEIHL